MSNRRLLRVAGLLREEIYDIIRREVHDPRVTDQDFTVTRTEVSPDLSRARIMISSLLPETARNNLLLGLNHASGYIHLELMRRIRLKTIPALVFEYDDGLEKSQRIADLIHSLKREERP